MKRIWNMLRGKPRRDDRGMTLVEVVCAVGILALVAGVIGTVIVVSTRTYRRGISETGIQQEAQLVANNIGNLVKDACSVVYGESGQQYLENGDTPMTDTITGLPKMQATGYTELSIITNDKAQYTMTYDDANSTLMYQEFAGGAPRTDVEIMASNIVAFKADTSDFRKNKTIKLEMTVEDRATNKRIPMEYTMTSRNDAMDGFEYVAHEIPVTVLFPEGDVVLVPGETYKIPIVVSGKLTDGGLEWDNTGDDTWLDKVALTLDYAEVTVKKDVDITVTDQTIRVRTKDKKEDGTTPKGEASCKILIRRVKSVTVSHTIDTTNATGGMMEAVGAEYTFSASVAGNELAKRVAYDFDEYYETAQATAWSCVLKVNGAESKYDWGYSKDSSTGKWEFAEANFATGAFNTYFDVVSTQEDVVFPSFTIKVKKALPASLELTVRATSKHALGVNKAKSDYGTKDDTHYYGEDTIEPRETIMKQGLEITLEPFETGGVKIGMKGGMVSKSDLTFDYHGASDLRNDTNTLGTVASYNETTGEVEITLGKNEKGGKDGMEPYTFTVDVKAPVKDSGSTVIKVITTITVHVCRIDDISIEVIDNFEDKKGGLMTLPTYDFRARFNVKNGSLSDMQNVTKYLIRNKADGSVDAEAVKKTLSSEITWQLFDPDGKIEHEDSVICMAGVGVTGEIQGSYTKNYKGKSAKYDVENVKPARIEQDESGKWFIKQLPEIDISPSAGTTTGLPDNYELRVTIKALHPSGTNATSKVYTDKADGVLAVASIFGNMTIKAPSDFVIMEPLQGVNDMASSDKEIVIPLEVDGVAVYSMKASISENSSADTKLCSYSLGNPYKDGNATSMSNLRTWYLGLLIGESEIGNYNGRIKVHVDAYNTSKKVIASTDFELGVRRVDNVNVTLSGSKKISAVNKEGSTMTLKASPAGRNGTEYYDMQVDDAGNARRWEQKGHGEYKEPSDMEWTMLMKGTEKPLAEWTDYIVEDSVKPSVNRDDHEATVAFKLKKAIPIGTKIRAYSLHARGSNCLDFRGNVIRDESSADYVKYNKSGKKYAGTYGEFAIIDDGFQRADEFTFVENITNMREKFNDSVYDAQQRCFYRYRIKKGTWSYYYRLEDESETQARFVGPKESLVFLPEYDYDVEIISVVYSRSKKLIYWPLDDTLLEDGRGWKEEGFRLWNGDEIMKNSNYSGTYKDQMIAKEHALYDQIKASKEKWLWNFDVPKITINFEIGNARQWKTKDTSVTLANMSASAPIHLQGGSTTMDWIPGDEIAVELAPTSFCLWKKQYHMNAYVDQKVNGQWKEVAVTESGWDAPSPNGKETYWHLQTSCPQFQIYQVYCRGSAEYRIRTMIKDMEWMKVEGRLFDRTYVGYKLDTPLFDMSNGDGVLYLKFN